MARRAPGHHCSETGLGLRVHWQVRHHGRRKAAAHWQPQANADSELKFLPPESRAAAQPATSVPGPESLPSGGVAQADSDRRRAQAEGTTEAGAGAAITDDPTGGTRLGPEAAAARPGGPGSVSRFNRGSSSRSNPSRARAALAPWLRPACPGPGFEPPECRAAFHQI